MSDIQLATKSYVDLKVLTNVPANAKFTDTVYSHPTSDGNKHVPANGTTNNGKVLKATATAGTYTWADDNDTVTTINGKTGAIIKADIVALGIPSQDTVYTHPATHAATMITGLSTVATSGSYADLSNKPTIPTVPTKLSAFTNDSAFITGTYDNSTSGLTATTLQGAIDELKALFDTLNTAG